MARAKTMALMRKFPKVLATGEVAKLLDVSYQYIDKLAKEGRLRFQQTASGRVYLEDDVLDFMRERDRKAKTDSRIKNPKIKKQKTSKN